MTRLIIPALVALLVSGSAMGKHQKYSQIVKVPVNEYFGVKSLRCTVEQDKMCTISKDVNRCRSHPVYPLSMIKVDFEKKKFYSFPKSGEKWAFSEVKFGHVSSTGFNLREYKMFLAPVKFDESGHPVEPYNFIFSSNSDDLKGIRAVFGKCFATEPF